MMSVIQINSLRYYYGTVVGHTRAPRPHLQTPESRRDIGVSRDLDEPIIGVPTDTQVVWLDVAVKTNSFW